VMTPGQRYIKNMKKAFNGYIRGEISYETAQSYIGMGRHVAAFKAMNKALDLVGYK